MEPETRTIDLALPLDVLSEVEAAARREHRSAADLLCELVEQGLLERRQWQAHAERERQRSIELGIHDPADDEPMTDEYRQSIREKIDQGLASAGQGKLVDGETVFARIKLEMAALERQGTG